MSLHSSHHHYVNSVWEKLFIEVGLSVSYENHEQTVNQVQKAGRENSMIITETCLSA